MFLCALLAPCTQPLRPVRSYILLSREPSYLDTGCGTAGAARRRKGGRSRRNTELAGLVRGALEQTILVELLPRAQVDVCVQVLFADGGVTAACINAAMLAVADAGAASGLQAAPQVLLARTVLHYIEYLRMTQ